MPPRLTPPTANDEYAVLARFYDLDHGDIDGDIAFWLGLARRAGGPILEIGCGSGRIAVPLAEAGYQVTGVDTSPAMLARLANRVASGRPKLAWRQADARDLDLPGQRFRLIIAGLGVAHHFLDHGAMRAALARFRSHLADDGYLAIDLANPTTLVDQQPDGLLYHDWTRVEPATGQRVVRLHARRTDPLHQLIETTFFYDVLDPAGSVERFVAPVALRWYTLAELDLLLEATGFAIKMTHGDWDLSDYDADSPRLIVIARPHL